MLVRNSWIRNSLDYVAMLKREMGCRRWLTNADKWVLRNNLDMLLVKRKTGCMGQGPMRTMSDVASGKGVAV